MRRPDLRPLAQRHGQEHAHEDDLRRPPRGRGLPQADALREARHLLRGRLRPNRGELPGQPHSPDVQERDRGPADPGGDEPDRRVRVHPARQDARQEEGRPHGPRPRRLRPGAARDHPLRQGAQGAGAQPPRGRLGHAGRRPGVLVQGPQGQARLHQGRRVRARHTRREEVPALEVRDHKGQEGVRGAGLLRRRLRRPQLRARRVDNHLQGRGQRDLPQQGDNRLRHRQDRRHHEQRHVAAGAEPVLRREADPRDVLRAPLPRPPGLRRHPGRAGDIPPRLLAADARGLLQGHMPRPRRADDRRHPLAAGHTRRLGLRQGAEAFKCAST